MRDLHRRLGTAGFSPEGAEAGVFCPATEAALRSFQLARGLPRTGWCDEYTWAALVEATWILGDRLLTLTDPMIRGDDVSSLQVALARLGFDPGKVDGILGVATNRALQRFQRDCGLTTDGICGPETVRALDRLMRQSGSGPGVAVMREREILRQQNAGSLAGSRIVVGQFGGLTSLVRSTCRQLRSGGALVVPVDEPDPYVQAQAANHFGADLYIGIGSGPAAGAAITYYAVPEFESAAGHDVATIVALGLRSKHLFDSVETSGQRLPILRETRMPAVLCTLGPPRRVADQGAAISGALAEAISAWIRSPRG